MINYEFQMSAGIIWMPFCQHLNAIGLPTYRGSIKDILVSEGVDFPMNNVIRLWLKVERFLEINEF